MARFNEYTPGSLVKIAAAFTNTAGAATDPDTITFSWKDPVTATVTSAVFGASTMVKDSVGNYHFNLSVTNPGDYWYRWVGTGAVQAASENMLRVNTTRVS